MYSQWTLSTNLNKSLTFISNLLLTVVNHTAISFTLSCISINWHPTGAPIPVCDHSLTNRNQFINHKATPTLCMHGDMWIQMKTQQCQSQNNVHVSYSPIIMTCLQVSVLRGINLWTPIQMLSSFIVAYHISCTKTVKISVSVCLAWAGRMSWNDGEPNVLLIMILPVVATRQWR